MKDFRTLNVWNKAHDLTLDLYKVTKLFPKEETYGGSQANAGLAHF
jgi:S23 ribosomal protein.